MKNSDLCPLYCGGKEFVIPIKGCLTKNSLILNKEKNRAWYFSIVGNNPINPKIALVSLCPAHTQLTKLIKDYNSGCEFKESASSSGFNKMKKNIARMLRKIGTDKQLGIAITDDFDFNNSPFFFTTSLVKCASMKKGRGRSNEYNKLKFNTSRLCLTNRFMAEITNPKFNEMNTIIIFGKKEKMQLKD